MTAADGNDNVRQRLHALVQQAVIAVVERSNKPLSTLTVDELRARDAFRLDQRRNDNNTYVSYAALKCAAVLAAPSADLAEQFVGEVRRLVLQSDEYSDMGAATITTTDGFITITLPQSSSLSLPPSPQPSLPASITTFPSFTSAPPLASASRSSPLYLMPSIATFHSVFSEKYGTPRQGALSPSTRGCVELHASVPVDSVQSLSSFSHVWLLFLFHLSLPCTLKPKVKPPRLRGRRVGVFASRSPHRPAPIGLTVCRLERVEGRRLWVSGVDAVDGSPVLDIKPYHPADCVPDATFPAWVQEDGEVGAEDGARLWVRVDDAVRRKVAEWAESGALQYYRDGAEALSAVEQCIAGDPRTLNAKSKHRHTYGTAASGAPQQRDDGKVDASPEPDEEDGATDDDEGGAGSGDVIYGIALDRMDVAFRVAWDEHDGAETATVFHVELYADGQPRTKLRTREWYAAMRKVIAEQRRHQADR